MEFRDFVLLVCEVEPFNLDVAHEFVEDVVLVF